MPKPSARRATARPMPPEADDAERLAVDVGPPEEVPLPGFHWPERAYRSASTTRRAAAISSAQAKSAVVSVSTSGVLVTTTPRRRAAATSMLL